MSTRKVTYTEAELLASHDYEAPLIAGGVRCHGGFVDAGTYVSPRTLHRVPAIEAWNDQRAEQFGGEALDVPLDTWPEHFPNVAQAKWLIDNGAPGPIITTLTRIGTVEGFGAMIRSAPIPDLERCFDEDIDGTAMAHLGGGLYEAHARDEAGHGDEGGHKQMWFAARDLAFEHPDTEDETALMLERMGITAPGGEAPDPEELRRVAIAQRVLPDDVDFDLEMMVVRMARLLLIEISAHHTFAWAEEVLSDRDLVAGDGEAATLVSYIRDDEKPHVEYLKTTLSEMRDRTFVGSSGGTYPGTEIVGTIWDAALATSRGAGRNQTLDIGLEEVEEAIEDHPERDRLLEGFWARATVRRGADGRWHEGLEPEVAA